MRIFNQSRKELIKNRNLKHYSIYALGEIVLVVIGILIALQINNWKEDRQINKERLSILEILYQSFEKNQLEIEETMAELEALLETTNLRILNTGPQIQNVSDVVIAKIRVIEVVNLQLPNNLSNNVIINNQNGSLLSSEIRNLLLEYLSMHLKYKNTEDNLTQIQLKLRENHQKYISLLSEATSENNLESVKENMFESNYINWLRDRENQNISVESKWKIEHSIMILKDLDNINTMVLGMMKKEIAKH